MRSSYKVMLSMVTMMVLCTGVIASGDIVYADDGIEPDADIDNGSEERTPTMTFADNNSGLVVGSLVIVFCMIMFALFLGRVVMEE